MVNWSRKWTYISTQVGMKLNEEPTTFLRSFFATEVNQMIEMSNRSIGTILLSVF
jgi:hypothetical protein